VTTIACQRPILNGKKQPDKPNTEYTASQFTRIRNVRVQGGYILLEDNRSCLWKSLAELAQEISRGAKDTSFSA
jgi:hypothetical protein